AVEIAGTQAERAQGLMFRRDLPSGQGMLFIYESPQPVEFWMRNTLIALDMIFIDARGEVRHVHPMAQPLDETGIPGAAPGDAAPERLMVLEVRGGDAARLGIFPGMALSHPALPQDQALAPCDCRGPAVSFRFPPAHPAARQRHEVRGVAQPGSATVLGTVGRRFESARPDHVQPHSPTPPARHAEKASVTSPHHCRFMAGWPPGCFLGVTFVCS